MHLRNTILTHLKSLIRPLVRFCFRHSITLQELIAELKTQFVEVAREELSKSGDRVSISRLSVATGLQRKEITRLTLAVDEPRSTTSLLTRVIGQWQQGAEFVDRSTGQPRILLHEGAGSEFARLVRATSKDLNPYTVLFELERAGFVERKKEGLKLRTSVFVAGGPEKIRQGFEILECDSHDLISAVTENVMKPEGIPNLHLRTEYDNICVDAIPELKKWLLDKGTSLHEEARSYLAQYDKDVNPRLYEKHSGARVALSAFSFVEQRERTVEEQ